MLKFYYANESDIPDNLKGAYEVKNGRYELARLADDVPVIAHNKTLVNEKAAEESKANDLSVKLSNAERDLTELKTKSVPNGFRAVPKADFELLDAIKPLNLSKDELTSLKSENEQFKTEKAQTAELTNKTRAFEFAGVKDPSAALKLSASNDLKIEWKEINGKQTPFHVSEKDGQKVETAIDKDFINRTDGFKEFAGALFADTGRRVMGMESGNGGAQPNSLDAEIAAQAATGRYSL